MQWISKTAGTAFDPRATRSHLSAAGSRLLGFATYATLSLAAASLWAQAPDADLEAASRTFREGNYRLAAERLTSLSKSVSQFLPQQQITYWDLQVNLALASGRPALAEQAAFEHLALLKQASAIPAQERADIERQSLVRLAQIKLALSGAESSDDATHFGTTPFLHEACALYRQALEIPRKNDDPNRLWEAETRFELARALELLKKLDEAKTEYATAARAAETALAKLQPTDEAIDEFLRGATVVREAFLSDQKADKRQQAGLALRLLQARLQEPETSPSERGKLLLAIAACHRQAQDSERERQILEQLFQDTEKRGPKRTAEIGPLARADALIRLAELVDAGTAPPPGQPTKQSEQFYRDATDLYTNQLADIKKADASEVQLSGVAQQTADRGQIAGHSSGRISECLIQLQLIHMRLEDWTTAIENTQELLKLRGLLLARNDPNYYRTLSVLGSLHAKRARAAWMIAVGDEQGLLNAREDVRNAREYLSQAYEFWGKHQPQSPKDLATTLNHYAEVLRYDGDFRSADKLLNELATIAKSHRVFGSNDLRLAEFYTNRAAVQATLGQYFLALDNYRSAARIAGLKASDDREWRERRRLLAMVYLNVAQLHKSQRQLAKARQACEEALAEGDKAGLTKQQLVPFQLANASLLIAEAEYIASQSAQEAARNELIDDIESRIRERLADAITLAEAIVESGASPLELATARHLQALARYRFYELCNAGEHELQAAEKLWTDIVDKSADDFPQIITLRTRASNYLVTIALRDLARLRRQTHALSLADNRDEEQIARLTSQCSRRLADADRWSQSGEESAGGLIAYPAIHVQALLARAQVLRANAQIRHAKAKGLKELNSDEAAHEMQLAATATSDAIAKLQEAVKAIEMPRAMTVGAEEERAEYFAQFAPVFDLLVDLLFENGRYVEAIQVAEMRRSRTFQDQLRTSGINLYETSDPKLVAAAKKARDRYYAALTTLNENWSDKTLRNKLSAELGVLRGEFVQAEQQVKSSSSAARRLLLDAEQTTANVPGPDADEWVSEQIGDGAIALLYYIGAGKSYVFACGREFGVIAQMLTLTPEQSRLRGLPLPAPQDGQPKDFPLRAHQLAKLVMDVRGGVQKPSSRRGRVVRGTDRGDALQLTVSAKVGPETDYVVTDILLPPELRQKIIDARPSHLIVIPDGALHQLPLELLPYEPKRTNYVLDKFPPISYAPSLHIYRTLRMDRRFGEWDVALLSVADPRYRQRTSGRNGNDTGALSSADREFLHYSGEGLMKLDGFKKESDAICSAFQKAASNPGGIVRLVDENATEEKLKDIVLAHRIGFLHVAAHGLVSQQYNNLFGALALTPPDRPTERNDGFLSLHEVVQLELKGCEMAVLSACETNCGAESPLEAGSTMARAFICAGATRVVCSHWAVDDDATTALITDLMQQVSSDIKNNRRVDFATALHAAKVKLRRKIDSPYFWAPFVLIGPPSGGRGAGEGQLSATAGGN